MAHDDQPPLRLPRLYSERDAAEVLGISVDTIRRERQRRKLAFTRIAGRIRYTETSLSSYIEDMTEPCRKKPSSSAPTSSTSDEAPITGADAGTTLPLDRHAAHRLAQATFKPRRRD